MTKTLHPNKRIFTADVSGPHKDGVRMCRVNIEFVGWEPSHGVDETTTQAIHAALSYLCPPGKRIGVVVEE